MKQKLHNLKRGDSMSTEKGSDAITIEEIRKKADLTQAQFARSLGLSVRSYINRLDGSQSWKLDELILIAEKYQTKFEIKSGRNYQISIKDMGYSKN